MTVREFMLKKFPTNKWMDCPVPKHHWETIQEYADAYHEWKVKNISSKPVLADSKTILHRCSCEEGNPVEVKICLNCDGILE